MHVDFASYLAACMFFPLPSAPVEPHLSLENDKQDDSCEQISVRNESLKRFVVSEMKEKRRAKKMDEHQVKQWAKDGCVTKTDNNT